MSKPTDIMHMAYAYNTRGAIGWNRGSFGPLVDLVTLAAEQAETHGGWYVVIRTTRRQAGNTNTMHVVPGVVVASNIPMKESA